MDHTVTMALTSILSTAMRAKVTALLGTWSRPPDLPAKIALGLAGLFVLFAIFGRGKTLLGFVTSHAHTHTHTHAEIPFSTTNEERREEALLDRRRFLAITSLAAALISIAYVSNYLHGGPRIIDATTYFLQARALSHGDLSWTPLDPSSSFRGRFLLYTDGGPDGPTLGGIFPPGYPLLLAFGFLLGSPMLVGPLIAAALIVATYKLAYAIAEESALPILAEPIARGAALVSLVCGALRYHTADTMSHGASALAITIALTFAIRARAASASASASASAAASSSDGHRPSPFDHGRGEAILAGLALGYVLSTRPASALPIAIVVVWLLRRQTGLALLGVLPGLFLLLLSQRAVTGSWFLSTQRMYYATSDGPPGCFRWGFGKGTGCVFEHGDFVQSRLEHGYGIVEALGTTLRRLRKHLLDVANLEPLALLVLVPAFLRSPNVLGVVDDRTTKTTAAAHRPTSAITVALVLVGLQILAYVPFYFDGDYPGGGARFFADVLPVEHVLLTIALAMLATRNVTKKRTKDANDAKDRPAFTLAVASAFTRGVFLVLALSLAGFAIHASYEHVLLRDRDGGHPMFEPDVLSRVTLTNGLVFIESDHGFALAHDPSARTWKKNGNALVFARLRNDDRDRMLYEKLEKPPTYLYKLEPPIAPSTESTPTLTPWTPADHATWLRFEGEAEWPPLSQEGGFAVPGWTDGCASGRRALVLTPTSPDKPAYAKIEIPVPTTGKYTVEIHLVERTTLPFAPSVTGKDEGTVSISSPSNPLTITLGSFKTGPNPSNSSAKDAKQQSDTACFALPTKEVDLVAPRAELLLEVSGAPMALDYVALKKSTL